MTKQVLSCGGVEWGTVGVTMPLEQEYVAGSNKVMKSSIVGEQSLGLPGDPCYQSGCLQRLGHYQQRSPRNLARMRSFGQT